MEANGVKTVFRSGESASDYNSYRDGVKTGKEINFNKGVNTGKGGTSLLS